jgi:ribonuclease III
MTNINTAKTANAANAAHADVANTNNTAEATAGDGANVSTVASSAGASVSASVSVDVARIAKTCAALGYTFKNPELLQQALCHRSVGAQQSNERLEFLGDAALNFVIAAELFRLYPAMREGDLSRLRSNLVNGELMAEIARELQLWGCLYLGGGEVRGGGSHRGSILADAMEAVIGAIYLDGGLNACRERILHWYGKRLEAAHIFSYKDPKTRLQELVQAKKLPLPAYAIVKVDGATHEQTFHIECRVQGVEKATVGSGRTKRKAEQNAAEQMLTILEA